MKALLKALAKLPVTLLIAVLYFVTFRWLGDFIDLFLELLRQWRRRKSLKSDRRGRPNHCPPRCAVIPPEVYKRADPLIYSQQYLREQGLAVTWNNPDIQLYKDGVAVSSHNLLADTDYVIDATIYNNSTEAPAVGLPVQFSIRSFGVGAAGTLVGTQTVNLPVKGAPGHPAHARQVWRTPAAAGHYCIRVELIWPDDANPRNNVGQENTDVRAASSPAVFRFLVRNDDTIAKTVRLVSDAYRIPAKTPCGDKPDKGQSDRRHKKYRNRGTFIPPSERKADWTFARLRHDPEAFPMPKGWRTEITPSVFDLDPGAQRDVMVSVTPVETFKGEQPVNVNAFHGVDLLGGVTLIVTK